MLRFTAPQILGYYMQAVTEDKSTSVAGRDQAENDDSIRAFVEVYKKFIDELNKNDSKI